MDATRPQDAERANQTFWDEIAPVHVAAYKEVAMLRAGESVLDPIELREIGDVTGKTLLHLQCHIGTDTLSWAQEGAEVTGVDFSPQSIAAARRLRDELNLAATFIQANIYDVPQILDQTYDIVYTSRGVLCWLRDLTAWGQVIARTLKPGGIFYIMEQHPIINTLEETENGELVFRYRYFHAPEPTKWDAEGGDYADATYIVQNPTYEWSWSISDIVNALLNAGLQVEHINEYERLFFQYFPGMVPCSDRWYDLPKYRGKLPLLFTLKARQPGIAQCVTGQ
jgi:SAM-dependent methyltransferase